MEYKKIHSCLNNCILYRNEFEDLRRCSMCDLSRYKVKVGQKEYNDEVTKEGPLAKVVWYLSIISRLKCLFATTYDAKIHRWHVDDRKIDGLRRLIYKEFLEFVKESRNLRLGLVTNGMNPFGNLSSNHSSLPILLMIYNLPPVLCMERKYMMLSMMIFGPKQPGNDIDVYLNPLIEDLKLLWDE